MRQDISGYHPGLLSGLVLAGANKRTEDGKDSGILTALEVEQLDLSRVDLVTLSACETGLGTTAGGEGVLGLQRAFQIAGARNVVASLWKVDDRATALLMRLFYQNLWHEHMPPIEALRQAQLTVYRHPELIEAAGGAKLADRGPDFTQLGKLPDAGKTRAAPHAPPRLWAAFVLSGAGM